MQGDALGRTRSDSGELVQRRDKGNDRLWDWVHFARLPPRPRSRPRFCLAVWITRTRRKTRTMRSHPNPGRLSPDVTLPISALEISLAWPNAWFAAVKIISSTNCASEGLSAWGSILTDAIVPSHLATTLTA